jgi:hypothetical protein
VRLTLTSIASSAFIAAFITLFIYLSQGMKTIDTGIFAALVSIFKFWFILSWNITLLLALFLSLKYIFNNCIAGYKLNLLSCTKEDKIGVPLKIVGYGDLVKVWRKWLMLLIWLVGAQMILALIFMKLFSSYVSIFGWFNIYVLYFFILLAGYFSFMILSVRCKKVRIVKC